MSLDNDLLNMHLTAGMVGLSADQARDLLEELQCRREGERETERQFDQTNQRFQRRALQLLDKLRELDTGQGAPLEDEDAFKELVLLIEEWGID